MRLTNKEKVEKTLKSVKKRYPKLSLSKLCYIEGYNRNYISNYKYKKNIGEHRYQTIKMLLLKAVKNPEAYERGGWTWGSKNDSLY